MKFGFGWELLIPVLIDFAKKAIDEFVNGAALGPNEVRGIMSAYFESKVWATKLVESTETPYDDLALEAFWSLCEDTAQEGGFALPTIPALPK